MGATLSSEDDLPPRDRWARLRFAIVGPLLAAPPVAGELHEAVTVLAAKTWRHPFTGLDVRFGVSTIERWLYAAKGAADPVRALRNQVRRDIGRFPSLSAEAVAALTTQYGNHPGWTAQLHHGRVGDHLVAQLIATERQLLRAPHQQIEETVSVTVRHFGARESRAEFFDRDVSDN